MSVNISYILRKLDGLSSRSSLWKHYTRRKVKKSTVRRKTFKKRINARIEEDANMMNKMTDQREIFLGASDLSDMLTCKLLNERIHKNMECLHETFGVYVSQQDWKKYIKDFNMRKVIVSQSRGFLFDDDALSFIEYNVHSTHVSIELIGGSDFIDDYFSKLTNDFEIVSNHVEWIYGSDGNSIDVPIRHDRVPIEEMYPFLNGKNLGEYYDDFMKSSASILLLIGPPGTGKTTFIRGMLQHCNVSAMVSYDSNVLEKDFVFANFIEGDKSILVLEDADMFLKSRQEGNTMMHKFLNVGDGLVTTKNKKLVFSTNLPSIRDIDPALVRPGRCYDIITFRELDQKEAEKLASKFDVTLKDTREKWTISDIFFEQNMITVKPINRKVGFV